MKPKSLNEPKPRKVRCGQHGKQRWKGDLTCIHCNAIWVCERAADPKAEEDALQFRLLNTRQYLDGENGQCVCGRDLLGPEGTGRIVCSECVAQRDHGVQ